MRVVELSNHPVDLLEREQASRRATEASHKLAHEEELQRHRAQLAEVRQARAAARKAKRWWLWLRHSVALWVLEGQAPRPPRPVHTYTAREASVAAGAAAEQRIAEYLAGSLGDEWVLLCGYSNRRGEIDQLLLGPGGLFAIEIKYRNATVHCDADEWWYDKYDAYGNLVEEDRPISDKRGRSPSVQLREPVSELEAFLARRGQATPITPVVLFTHERSELGSLRNLTVNVATNPDYVVRLASSDLRSLDRGRCAAIERLVIRDHTFHEQRHRRRQ